jgi:hypothetical protein
MYSSAWKSSFGFYPNADAIPEVIALKAMGVHKVDIRIGCTTAGEVFTDLVEVSVERGVAVDVMWLKRVRDLCEAMTPMLVQELRTTTEPDDDVPEDNLRASIDLGNYFLHVALAWRGEEASMSADFYFPASEAEVGSRFIRRDTRRLLGSK